MISKSLTKRIISSVIMMLVIALWIYITTSLNVSGRIIGLIVVIGVGIYTFVETIIITIKRYVFFLIFGIISIILIFSLDYSFLGYIVNTPNRRITAEFGKIFSWWTFIIPFLSIIPIMFIKNHDDKVTTNNIFFTIMFIILLTLFMKVIFMLAVINWSLILFLILIAIIFDTFAYIGGHTMGKKIIKYPFTPILSPNKTWEGFILGYLTSFIFIVIFGHYMHIFSGTSNDTLWLIVAAFALPGACQIGDLFFSSVKRTREIKDFSQIIPGHGGVLDRIDGLIFIVIMFTAIYGISLFGVAT